MRNRILKSIKLLMVLFCISLASILSLSCSSGDDDDGGENTPQTYNASGTYVYDSVAAVLTATFTYSEFLGCGPVVGVETNDVDTILATTMVWNDGEEDMLTWERESGIPGDITGTWDRIDDDGNTYELTLDASGAIHVIADIVECSDGGQCNINAIVRLHNGALVTGATVTADGKSCTTSAGTCTVINVMPCGDVFTTTASYLHFSDVSSNVSTLPNGGTSQVQLKFASPTN